MRAIDILVAKYLIGISALLVVYVFIKLPRDQKMRFVIEAAIGGVLIFALAKLGSHLFYNPRPFVVGHFTPYFPHGNDNGFPSDHTLLSSFLGFLVLKYNKTLGYVLLSVAAIIGLSRVIAGVHHLLDVLGAFAFAGIGMGFVYLASNYFGGKKTYSIKPKDPAGA